MSIFLRNTDIKQNIKEQNEGNGLLCNQLVQSFPNRYNEDTEKND